MKFKRLKTFQSLETFQGLENVAEIRNISEIENIQNDYDAGVGAAGIGGGGMYCIGCGFEGLALGGKGAAHSLAMGITRTRVMN